MDHEFPDVQAGFRKGGKTSDQIANICWIIKNPREFQKSIYFCFIDYTKAFDYVDKNTLWKILKEIGIPDHLTCLLRNLCAGQEAAVRTGHGPTDWFQIGKWVRQGCILSPCLFNLYAEHIMGNKQGDNIQPWHTPFPIWNQSVVPCPVLTVASWPAYKFLRIQVRWSDSPISWRILHSLLWSTQWKALV